MNLDDALADWAAATRLPDDAAAEIYQRIIAIPAPSALAGPGLNPGWWRRFTAECAVRVITSTQPVSWAT
jgi:hypothetical protein